MSDLVNGGFWDLSADERGTIYDRAERETGVSSFWDLDPEDRSRYYDMAEEYNDEQ